MNRQQRQQETDKLLRKIQQQRTDLINCNVQWLAITAPYDRGWIQLVGMRKYVLLGASLLALYSIRHPRRLFRWSKRVIEAGSAINLIWRNLLTR